MKWTIISIIIWIISIGGLCFLTGISANSYVEKSENLRYYNQIIDCDHCQTIVSSTSLLMCSCCKNNSVSDKRCLFEQKLSCKSGICPCSEAKDACLQEEGEEREILIQEKFDSLAVFMVISVVLVLIGLLTSCISIYLLCHSTTYNMKQYDQL